MREFVERGVFIETYGCQMNVSDSEVILSILTGAGYRMVNDPSEASVHLINTCAIRENAERKVFSRLRQLKGSFTGHDSIGVGRIVGVLGCMASHQKEALLGEEYGVDLVIGPDSYRELPALLDEIVRGASDKQGQRMAVRLSRYETYDDIQPKRIGGEGLLAYTSIMRGCNNACSYCIVPFTRGRERSREPGSILREVGDLVEQGYSEVTLLGQNVNSYLWTGGGGGSSDGGLDRKAERCSGRVDFPSLVERLAMLYPSIRLRYSTSHPKDLSDELLRVMRDHPNVCPHIHLPVQSGSSRMLKRMGRDYTREHYLDRIYAIRDYLPHAGLSTDIIAGFSGETVEDHEATLSLMEQVRYDSAFMFKYSEREGTIAHHRLSDDIPEEEKTRRLQEIIELQNRHALESNRADVGREFEVLVEGPSKRSSSDLCGRTGQYKMVVFPRGDAKAGEFRRVRIVSCTSSTLLGRLV